ncbi:unnamed protein product [Linum trigynum]|uniref:Gnk2-homologous domain-containing protein n=1 Tax=Linum trigynum TaxID=586398 RepID=A0AAV2EZ44_9ROSI
MGSSSSLCSAVLLVLVITSLGIRTTTAQEMEFLCNSEKFPLDDPKRVCTYHMLDDLLGWGAEPEDGRWYDSWDCEDGRSTIYGFRYSDRSVGRCIGTAKDILQNRQCRGHIGGRAWGVGCYMRFEIVPFDVDDDE